MILFLFIFILLSFLSTALKFSLAENKKQLWMAFLIIFLFGCGIYPISIQQNIDTWKTILQNKEWVSSIAVLQIIESILTIMLSVYLIKGHFSKKTKWSVTIFSVIPSLVLLGGLFLLQIFAFVYIEGISFELMALAFAFSVALMMLVAVFLSKFILSEWAIRAELKIILSFVQILFAMFLPIIVNEIKVPFSNLHIDGFSIAIAFSTIFFFMFIGIGLHIFFPKLLLRIKYKIK